MNPRDPRLQSFATSLAHELTARTGEEALALLCRLGVVGDGEPEPPPPARSDGAIGIWEPRRESDGVRFERSPERAAEWSFWADVETIAPKGSRKRVVLLGESVARGYFYDPLYTPARVLEEILGAAGVPGGVEVVDLAKNDLFARELGELLQAALALEPDAFVLFAGNNWAQIPSVFRDGLDRQLAAASLRQAGAAGLKAMLEAKIGAEIESRLRTRLAPLSASLPVVLLVPEFNLTGWKPNADADAPWLPGTDNLDWLASLADARTALEHGRIEEAEEAARAMVEIDRGTAASGLTLLAECALTRGDRSGSRRLFERARDAHGWDSALQVPKALSVVQKALRGGGGRLAVVDLPRVLEELSGELPGRRAFLDYCHLTSWGIRAAMAAAAGPLLAAWGVSGAAPEALRGHASAPEPRLEAEAHFAAAVHNAHWGQAYDVVRRLCDEALRQDPGIAEALRCYLDFLARRAPAWASRSYGRLASSGTDLLRRYVTTLSRGKLFDAILADAIVDALNGAGHETREALGSLRAAESGLGDGERVDLLDPYYRHSWVDRSGLWWTSYYYRAHGPTSRFPLVREGGGPTTIELTWRSPALGSGETAGTILVDGDPIGELRPNTEWKTERFEMPTAETPARGVSWIEIRWPPALPPGSEGIEAAARDVERGIPFLLLPVFAEVHSFHASSGSVPADG